MRTPVLDDFIDRTLAEYVPGHLSGIRITAAPVTLAAAPEPEYVDPADVLDDDDDEESGLCVVRTQTVYVRAIRRFAPPRRA